MIQAIRDYISRRRWGYSHHSAWKLSNLDEHVCGIALLALSISLNIIQGVLYVLKG